MEFKHCLLVAVLVSAVLAGPTGQRNSECSFECGESTKFFYEIGKRYDYKYEAETRTGIWETLSDEAVVKVSALATIQPVTSCEFVLMLSEVSLSGSDKSSDFATEVTRRPLRFAVTNGKVEHICGSDSEPSWVINFKKGVLSSFQNSMKDLEENEVLTETDVSGICETSYTTEFKGSEIVITKSKTPSECRHKPQIHQKLSTMGYTFDSLIQGLPIMKSTQECKQHISNEIIKKVSCKETHLFKPFSRKEHGAQTVSETTFELVEVKPSSAPFFDSFSSKKDLLFDFEGKESKETSLETTETILSKLDLLTQNGLKKEVPGLFSELVNSLKDLSNIQIQSVYERCETRLRTFIVDALPLVKTAESMGTFVDLILKGEMPEKEKDIWFTSLAFVERPTLEMFSAIEPLLESTERNKALLGISSLIHNFCKKDDMCESKPFIGKMLRNIESRLGVGCRSTSEEEKTDILYALKAIGNAGRFVNAESVLNRCYLEENPMEVRIAAIDAWRRVPCSFDGSHLLSTYSDQSQDNEIRIAAYLGLMKCPTKMLIDTVKDRLTSESVNQVASFVWTHLTNLQESAAEDKQWVRELIGEELLQKKFTSGALKLSRFFESSFYLKEQNFGASMDSSVIFASKSFLPRSSMLNMTVELFGESINLFEFGGRMEGFETYFEKFFGPDGYYPEETIAAIIKNLRNSDSKEDTNLESLITKDTNEPKGSYYLKLFGNELFYRHFDGVESLFPEKTFTNIFDMIMELARKGSIDFTKSYNLINSEFTYPTITGFPLRLKLDGKATVDMKLDGTFNFESFKSIDIQGKLSPSVAVMFDSSMMVDAFVTKSGMKMISTLHSSTSVEGKAVIEGGKLVDLKISVPEEKVEIYDMTNEFFKIENGVANKEIIHDASEIKKCLPVISSKLGLEICYEHLISRFDGETPYFPLSGPFQQKLYLKKTDTHTSYVLHYSHTPDKTVLLLDMPESKTDSKWSASLSTMNKNYVLDLYSPSGTAKGLLSYVFDKKEIRFDLEVRLNDVQTLKGKFKLAKEIDATHRETNLEMFYTVGGRELFGITGKTYLDLKSKSFNAHLSSIPGYLVPEFTTKLNVNRLPGDSSITFDLESDPLDLSLSGKVGNLEYSEGSIEMKGKYRLLSGSSRSLTTQIKYTNERRSNVKASTCSIKIDELYFDNFMKFEFADGHYASKVEGKFYHKTWNFEHTNDLIKTKSKTESKVLFIGQIPSWDVDLRVDSHTLLSDKQTLIEKNVKWIDYTRYTKFNWEFGKELSFNSKDSVGGQFMNFEIQKVKDGSYTLQYSDNLFGSKSRLEGSLETKFLNNGLDAKLKGLYSFDCETSTGSTDFIWTLAADENELKSETNLNNDGLNRFLIIHATKSSLSINNNFVKSFSAEAKVESKDDEKSFLITSNLDETIFEASGSFSDKSLQGILKYKEMEIKLLAKLHDQGVDFEVQLSPSQRLALLINYGLGKEKFLEVSLETPIKDWEKQDMRLSLVHGQVSTLQASFSWANKHHIGLTMEFKEEWTYKKESLSANLRFSSTLTNYERFELTGKYVRTGSVVNAKVDGKWNSEIIKGNFDAYPDEDGYKISMSFKSPFAEDFSLSFDHRLTRQDIASSIDFTYGKQKSRIILKGNMIDLKNMNASFICFSPFLPEINFGVSLQTSSAITALEIKGKYNGEKILFLANCDNFETNQDRICKMALKFVTSSFKVINGAYSNKITSDNGFESDIELSSSFISEQSVKGHIEGRFSSPYLAAITGYISGPKLSGRININHAISNEKIQTEGNLELNTFKLSVSVGGNVDLENKVGYLHAETESTLPMIDGYKLILQHSKQDSKRETHITLTKQEKSFNIYHAIIFQDKTNWSNYIKINDIFSVKNEMMSTFSYLKHISDISWLNKKIEFTFQNNYGNKLDLNASLTTPWTSLIRLELTHEAESSKRISSIKLEYGNGKTILMESEYEIKESSKYIKINVFNENWSLTPIKSELKIKSGATKSVDFDLKLSDKLQVSYQLLKTGYSAEGIFAINSSFIKKVSLTGKYSLKSDKKELYLEYEDTKIYSIDLKTSIDGETKTISSVANIPLLSSDPIITNIKYIIEEDRMQIILDNTVNSISYHLDALLENNSFILKSKCPHGTGLLNIKWLVEEFKKKITVDFKSPFQFVRDAAFSMIYECDGPRKIDLDLTYDVHHITAKATQNKSSIEIKATTTFQSWSTLSLSTEFKDSDREIVGIFTRENETFKFNFKEISKQEYEITVITPFSSFELNSVSFKYSSNKSKAYFLFNSKIGENVFKMELQTSAKEDASKQIIMEIQSPWEQVKKIYLEAIIDESSIKITGNFNKYSFDSILTANQKGQNDITVLYKLTSNIQGWTSYSVEANVQLTSNPYIASLVMKHEEQERNYYISLDLTENSFDLKVITPLEILKNVDMKGTYSFENNRLDTSFTATHNINSFKLSGVIDISSALPTININILTPFDQYKNIEFILSGALVNEKSINISYKLGDRISKLSIHSNVHKSVGTSSFSLSLPTFDFEDRYVQLSYDLDSETKHIMLDMKRGEITEKFSVEGRISMNEFNIEIESPIENYKRLVISGKYQRQNGEIIAYGKVMNEDNVYQFEGKVLENDKGYKIETSLPVSQSESLILNGEITKEKISFKFTKGGEEYEILINYMLKYNKAFIKLNTPFEMISYFALGGEYNADFDDVRGNVFLHRNEERLSMSGAAQFSPQKSNFKLSLKSSQEVNYSMNIFYDFISFKKEAGFSYEKGTDIQKYLIESIFDGTNHGFVKIYTTRSGYELNGFEYKFKTLDLSDTEAFVTLIRNSKEISFGIISKYKINELTLKFLTPFENYEEFGVESSGSFDTKKIKAKLMVGSYVFSFEALFLPDDFYLCVKTPYKHLEELKLVSKFRISGQEKFFNIDFTYNEYFYHILGKANISSNKPTIFLSLTTPFSKVKELEILFNFNINSPKELLDIGFKLNEIKYALKFGYQYHDYEVKIVGAITTPIEGWNNVKLNIDFAFNSDNKLIDIRFEREGDIKRIFFSGKLLEGDVDFDIETSLPIKSFDNFKTKGALSRSKRSVEFMMMNDEGSGGIVASFNSLKIKASTPFEKAKEILFEVTRSSKGGWSVHYSRNEHKVFFDFSAEPKKKGFDITIESEIPGWEFLALAGRLETQEIQSYIEGKLESGTIHITGTGSFGDKTGSLTVTSHSPFEKYQEVTTKLEYNAKRNIITFDSQSSSSDFKILVEFKRGLVIEVFVPNDEENTVASGKLTVFKGNLSASSRFEKIRTFRLNYNFELGQKITAKALLELNKVKLLELDFERDAEANTAHLELHGRLRENHSQIHFQRDGFKKLEFTFNRNGKEFKVDISGSGDIPASGTLEYEIHNSFREVPRTVTGKLEIDRTSSPKKLTFEVHWHDGKVYIFYLTYNVSLQNLRQGDFTLRSVTPERSAAPWKDISANWSFDDHNEGKAILNVGPKVYTATGKFGIHESDLVFESSTKAEKVFAQWKIYKKGNDRDYFVKVGRETKYVMFQLKGTFDNIESGDVSGSFKFARFMKDEFHFTSKWSRSSEGLTGGGTFSVGDYSGTHTLTNIKRDADQRAAKFHWEATSNIPNFHSVVLHGEYNLKQRFIDIKLSWDSEEISLKGSLQNLFSQRSENTIKFHVPRYGDSELTISHDCSNPLEGYFKIIGNVGSASTSFVAKWSTNAEHTKFHLHVERDIPVGKATLHVEFNAEDINDAKGSIHYNVGEKFLTIDISRKKGDTHLHDEVILKTDIAPISARVYLDADWEETFKLDSGIEWNDKHIEAHISIGPQHTKATITTPFERFGDIDVSIDYDLTNPKAKSVVLKYTRGDKEVNLNLDLKTPSKKSGKINLSLTTPFEVLQTLTLDASWKKGDFTATYKRNDLTYTAEGKAEIKTDLSSFDLKFTLPSGKVFEIKFSQHLEGFIKGTATAPEELISVKFHMDEDNLSFNVKGYRTSEKIYIEIDEETSIGPINTFHLKVDSELNISNREGSLELKVNDFHFNLRNKFEKRPDGFYLRSQIDSSLTALPGITIGFGKEGDSFILTTGWGDEREISFTLNGKERFRKGFYGTIDMPRRGIHGLEYSVDYSFESDDELHVGVKVQIDEGKYVDVDIVYDSEGVKGRLSSPWTGDHSARVKRSISEDYFMADVGVDNYGFTFENRKEKNSFKKGFKIEGIVLGEKYLFSGFINSDSLTNAEGKLIIETPFRNFEKLGGSFKTKLLNQKFYGQVDLNLVYTFSAIIDFDLEDKIKGEAVVKVENYTYEVSCDFLTNDSRPMKGKIIIKTPHKPFERIIIDSTISALSVHYFQGSFSSEFLEHSYNLGLTLKRDSSLYSLDATFNYDTKFEYRIISEYSLTKSPFYLKGTSSVFLDGTKLYDSNTEISFNGLNDMNVVYDTVCGINHFKGYLLLHSDDGKINGEIKAVIKDQKRLGITFNVPTAVNKGFMDFYFDGDQLHKVHLEKSEEISLNKFTLDIDCPTLLKGTFDLVLYTNAAKTIEAKIETPAGKNKFNLHFELVPQTDDFNQKKMVTDFTMESPISGNTINIYAEYEKRESSKGVVIRYKRNEIVHVFRGSFELVDTLRRAEFNIESPLLDGNIGKLILSWDFEDKIKLSLESTMLYNINNFYFDLNKKAIIISCGSPIIPTGMAKLEGHLSYESMKDVFFKINFANAEKTLTAQGKMKWDVDNETGILLEIRTPYDEYKKMEFGIQYIKGDLTHITIYANPFNLEAETFFGVKSEVFTTSLKIKTGLESKDIIKAKAVVPLTKIEPEFSALFHGINYELKGKFATTRYGAELMYTSKNIFDLSSLNVSYRMKAPYEYNYDFIYRDGISKFGIRVDNSIADIWKNSVAGSA